MGGRHHSRCCDWEKKRSGVAYNGQFGQVALEARSKQITELTTQLNRAESAVREAESSAQVLIMEEREKLSERLSARAEKSRKKLQHEIENLQAELQVVKVRV